MLSVDVFTSEDLTNARILLAIWWVGDKVVFCWLLVFAGNNSSFNSSLRLSEESKVWLAEAIDSIHTDLPRLDSLGHLLTMKCPLILRSALDDWGESLEAPVRELTDELSEGAVRGGGGRRGRTLVNYGQSIEEKYGRNLSSQGVYLFSQFNRCFLRRRGCCRFEDCTGRIRWWCSAS